MSCRTLGPASPPWPWCKGCPQKSHCCRPALLRPFSARLLALTLTFFTSERSRLTYNQLVKNNEDDKDEYEYVDDVESLMWSSWMCARLFCIQNLSKGCILSKRQGLAMIIAMGDMIIVKTAVHWPNFIWLKVDVERKAKLSLRKQLKSYQSKSTTVIKIAMNSNDVKLKTLTKILRWSEFCPARLLSSPHSSSFEFKDWKTFQRNLIWIKYSHGTICTMQIHNRA